MHFLWNIERSDFPPATPAHFAGINNSRSTCLLPQTRFFRLHPSSQLARTVFVSFAFYRRFNVKVSNPLRFFISCCCDCAYTYTNCVHFFGNGHTLFAWKLHTSSPVVIPHLRGTCRLYSCGHIMHVQKN